MARRPIWLRSSLITAVLLLAASALAEPPRADDTRNNAVAAPTADQQQNDRADLALTARIRRAILKDDTLSFSAHNVKVIAQAGVVTLRGPVKTVDEKTAVADKAIQIAGATHVHNELAVAP